MSSYDARVALQQARFNLIQNAADTDEVMASPLSRQLINTRLEMLEQNWTKFQEEHENLCISQSEGLREHEYVRSRVFERCQAFYVFSRAKLLTHRDEFDSSDRQSGQALSEPGASTSLMPRSALPRISLPTFSGDYPSWRPFHDLFTSIIRDNRALSYVEKMHYLKTSLSGEAARLVSNLSISNDNFEVAWNLLVSRYENKRFLITCQLDKLSSLKPLKAKSAKGLSTLLTTISEAIGALRSLGCAVHHWDPLLLHQLVKLLDPETREAWEIKLGSSTTFPTFAQFEEFLLTRTRALENLQSSATVTAPSKEPSLFRSGKYRSKIAAHVSKAAVPHAKAECCLCGSQHYVTSCDRFLSKSPQQRRDFVLQRQLCFNCLGSHRAQQCPVRARCKKCGNLHHTTLHRVPGGAPTTKMADAASRSGTTQQADRLQNQPASE